MPTSIPKPDATATETTPPESTATNNYVGLTSGWRIALFIWIASFAFLLLYEVLSTLFRIIWPR